MRVFYNIEHKLKNCNKKDIEKFVNEWRTVRKNKILRNVSIINNYIK